MAAYLVVDVKVEDPVRYRQYRIGVEASLAAYGGRYLVRGGRVDALEGSWMPERLVIVEFDSAEKAKAWWSSSEYAEPKALRQAIARTDMIVVEGV